MTDNEELAQLEELDETLQNAERDKLNAKLESKYKSHLLPVGKQFKHDQKLYDLSQKRGFDELYDQSQAAKSSKRRYNALTDQPGGSELLKRAKQKTEYTRQYGDKDTMNAIARRMKTQPVRDRKAAAVQRAQEAQAKLAAQRPNGKPQLTVIKGGKPSGSASHSPSATRAKKAYLRLAEAAGMNML